MEAQASLLEASNWLLVLSLWANIAWRVFCHYSAPHERAYDNLLRELEDEQGSWYVGFVLQREVNKLYAHTRATMDADSDSDSDSDSDGDSSDDGDSDSGDDDADSCGERAAFAGAVEDPPAEAAAAGFTDVGDEKAA
jgi:hypothetical protein